MKKLLNSKMLKNYLLLLLFIMGLEITFRMISEIEVFTPSLLRIFLGANVIALTLSYLFSWVSKKVGKVFMIISSFALSAYAFAQLGFNNFIGVYMSVNASSQLGAVTDYVREFLASFLDKFYFIFIPFGILLIYYIFIDRFTILKSDKRFPLKKAYRFEGGIRTISTILMIVLVCGLYYESLTIPFMQNDLQTVPTKDLFKNPSVPSTVVNEFGVLGFGFIDIKTLYTGIEDTPIYVANNNTTVVTNRSFDDSIWKEVIENESNNKMNQINNYLINNAITDYNDYTGIFEGKNLIVLMLESVNDIIINKEYYPNFYKMYSEGISFTNNYSPRNSCATINNEFSGMTGLYTINNTCTANIYQNNTYSNSIFNLFNNAGYKTSSMHNYTEQFYARSVIHKNMGSGKFYGVEALGIPFSYEYRNWASDEDFLKVAMDLTLNNNSSLESETKEPFMLWLTTVSSHQPYVMSSIEGDKYLSLFEDTKYPTDLKRYMSKLKVVDNALGIMLDRLSAAGILEDTVIVMYGDHYPYGLSNNTINYALDYDLSEYEVERVPLVIYNSEVTAQKVDKYNSYINLTPTIANLFGLDYDPRLYMGTDIFSDNYLNVVAFADGSWKNNKTYYNASTGKVKNYTEEEMPLDEVKRINSIITGKMQMSSTIIKNNYFAYLDKALAKVKTERESLAIEIPEEE